MLGNLKSGEEVWDRAQSHLHAIPSELLREALLRIEADGRDFFVTEVNFGYEIGKTSCVVTDDAAKILWAKRPKRFGYTRFVEGRELEPCSRLTVILKARDEGGYVLITAFIGGKAEPEPWDRNATKESLAFWSVHALVWGSEPIVPGSETHTKAW